MQVFLLIAPHFFEELRVVEGHLTDHKALVALSADPFKQLLYLLVLPESMGTHGRPFQQSLAWQYAVALEVELLGCGVVQRVVVEVGQSPQQSRVIGSVSELLFVPGDVRGFVVVVDEEERQQVIV